VAIYAGGGSIFPVLLIAVLLSGCGGTPSDGQRPRLIVPGEKVTLQKELGDYALVERADGEQTYVALDLLKHRNTAVRDSDSSFTHTVIRETPAYAQPPSEPPTPPEPRSFEKIDQEQRSLNGLFLSEKTFKEVIAPRDVARSFVDEETGERCWHAYECTKPDCPGEKTSGRAYFLFIYTDKAEQEEICCTACLKTRDVAAETYEEGQRYRRLVRPYELPETIRRRAKLDAERRRLSESIRHRGE
jgi:hypothetical protein